MKKIGKIVALASIMLCGYVGVANATCVDIMVDCGNGKGTYGLACGDNIFEILVDVEIITEITCN